MTDENQAAPEVPQTEAAAPPPSAPGGSPGRPGPASDMSKMLAALGYIIWIVALIAILIDPYKDEKFVKFHAMQALGLAVVGVILNVAWAVPFIGWIVGGVGFVVVFVYAIICAVKAWSGEYYEMPVIYGFIKGYVGE